MLQTTLVGGGRGEQEQHFDCLLTFWFSTFTIFLRVIRSLVGHGTLEDEWYVVIKAHKLAVVFFWYYHTLSVRAILSVEPTDSTIEALDPSVPSG